jgi:hypothetical protein
MRVDFVLCLFSVFCFVFMTVIQCSVTMHMGELPFTIDLLTVFMKINGKE